MWEAGLLPGFGVHKQLMKMSPKKETKNIYLVSSHSAPLGIRRGYDVGEPAFAEREVPFHAKA